MSTLPVSVETAVRPRKFRPRFTAYSHIQGREPAEQLAHDEANCPDCAFGRFILWLNEKMIEFRRAHPEHCDHRMVITNQAAFTRWLDEQVPLKILHDCAA